MESNEEILSKIVSERADRIQSEAIGNIGYIKENAEKELSRIMPDLMNQIENFSVFKLLDVLDILRNGGMVKTCDYKVSNDNTSWNFSIGSQGLFYETNPPYGRLSKGNYRVTLIMEKLAEKAEA